MHGGSTIIPQDHRSDWRTRIRANGQARALEVQPTLSSDLRLFLTTFVAGFLFVIIFFA